LRFGCAGYFAAASVLTALLHSIYWTSFPGT